jgi:signal transduction histidine kinase
MKIRTQLAYLFAVIVAAILLFFSIGIYYLSAGYRKTEFYERFREKAVTTARLLFEANQQITPQTLSLIDEQDSILLMGERLSVYDQNRRLLYTSKGTPEPIDSLTVSQLWQQRKWNLPPDQIEVKKEQEGREFLYKLVEEGGQTLTVAVSAVDVYGLDKLGFLKWLLFGGWLLSMAVIVAAGWIFAGNVLQPISDVITQVEAIEPDNLSTRRVKAGREKDEIAQLANTFNRMLDRLQKSFFIQKSFVANASHELRTPLTIMQGQLEVAMMQNRSDEDYRLLLQSLLEDVKDMSELANELLELAYASSEASAVSFRQVRIDEVVLQAEAELLRKCPAYDVIVDFEEAPEEEELYALPANERLLRNAFENLMENACKFSADKKVQVLVSFRPEAIVLRFIDRGIGIAEKELPFIFEPFFRSETVRAVSGHGIGLPLTQKIVEMHRGEISVQSRPGEGTTFTVSLPRLLK